MRQILFSRLFPATHPKKGEPTYFVEKIWKYLYDLPGLSWDVGPYQQQYDNHFCEVFGNKEHIVNIHEFSPKCHTIRSGNTWADGKLREVGDVFAPKVWSGLPYKSKTIQFAPPIETKKLWDIEIEIGTKYWFFKINGDDYSNGREDVNIDEFVEMLAKNDGLNLADFLNWFSIHPKKVDKAFTGQIICWDHKIEY